MTPKQLFALSLIAIITILPLFAFSPFASAQSGTSVGGLISTDTTWTKNGSPYTFTGSVGVSQGTTLTIEPGVTVNLGSYYLRVNGTLTAKGTTNDRITFNGGQLTFLTLSNGWNEQTQSGCIIQYATLIQAAINSVYPLKIDNCNINGQVSTTSSIITNNQITGEIHCQSSTITNNNVNGKIIIGTITLGGMTSTSDSSTVTGNTVKGTISSGSAENGPVISDNNVSGEGIGCTGYCTIKNNYVHDCKTGISTNTLRVFGGWFPCYATVEGNLITNNTYGIGMSLLGAAGKPTIQKNTISGNRIGISQSYGTPSIKNNNIQNNTEYNYYLETSDSVDVSGNWWGTTDEAAISQSIYDVKNNVDMGTVTFKPILTAPNPDAPTTPPATSTPTTTATNTPTQPPTVIPTQTPQASPTIPETTTAATLALIIAATLTAIMHRKTSRKQKYRSTTATRRLDSQNT